MEKIISSYECMFIINCASGDDAAKATVEKFTSTIEANAEIVEVAEWGRPRLSYPIDDMNEGYYIVFTFKSEGAFPAELQRLANIDESILRSMVIRLENEPTVKAAVEETAPATEEAPAEETAPATDAE